MNQAITYQLLRDLTISPRNPRKNINLGAIAELAESILAIGIIQPITCRRVGTDLEIVCGERRYRAADLANLETVPVIIRDLTDDEAFDLTITENLQRQDISPMEEAYAFRALIDERKYDTAALVAKFGKGEKYIRHRLRLTTLSADFAQLLTDEIILLGHALEICKLEPADQLQYFADEFQNRQKWWSCPTIKTTRDHIDSRFNQILSKASFSPKDAKLDPQTGPCTSCHKNTANDLALFPDAPPVGICRDRACFQNKTELRFQQKLQEIQETQPEVLIGYQSVYGEEEKRLKAAQKNGLAAIELAYQKGYREVMNPTPEQRSSGELTKAFIVAGSDKGKIVFYATSNGNKETSATSATKEAIKDLEAKNARNFELAFEKIYNDLKDLLWQGDYGQQETAITPAEWVGMTVNILSKNLPKALRKQIPGLKEDGYQDEKKGERYQAAMQVTQQETHPVIEGKIQTALMRNFILSALTVSSPLWQLAEANALGEIAREFDPAAFREINAKHQATYEKRKKALDARIDELKLTLKDETKAAKATAKAKMKIA